MSEEQLEYPRQEHTQGPEFPGKKREVVEVSDKWTAMVRFVKSIAKGGDEFGRIENLIISFKT